MTSKFSKQATEVNMTTEIETNPKWPGRQSSYREESGYIKHIVDNYHDLADWTVFLHGFPEEHNAYLFAWLDAFKRQKPESPAYIPVNSVNFIQRDIPKELLFKLGLNAEVDLATMVDSSNKHNEYLGTSTVCCAQFVVSSQAITRHSLDFYVHIQRLFSQKSFKLVVQQFAMNMRKQEQLRAGIRTAAENRTTAANSKFVDQTNNTNRTGMTNALTNASTYASVSLPQFRSKLHWF